MVKRYQMLEELSRLISDQLIVFYRVGIACFEWAQLTGDREGNIVLGDMGCTTGVGVGLACALPHRRVLVVDGDGSILLEPGILSVLANSGPRNLTVLVHDNESYESIGWSDQGRYRTETFHRTDIAAMARGAGLVEAHTARTIEEFQARMKVAFSSDQLHLVVVKTEEQAAQAPPRHRSTKEEKYRFIRYIERTEGKQILKLSVEKERLLDRHLQNRESK